MLNLPIGCQLHVKPTYFFDLPVDNFVFFPKKNQLHVKPTYFRLQLHVKPTYFRLQLHVKPTYAASHGERSEGW